MSRKFALIIGNSDYQDPALAKLVTPGKDASRLAEVFRSPDIGGFDEVTTLVNEPETALRRAIERLFAGKKKDDTLLLYFSGHGVLNEQGQLYLAVKDTEHGFLNSTAIPASFIRQIMDESNSRRQVLMLDCCNSGAFGRGAKAITGKTVGTAAVFESAGYGRVVLTATDAVQYAWEGEAIIGEASLSVFTHFLVEGLQTGAADSDGDGWIGLDELYDYVHEQVVRATPKQTPAKFADKQLGQLIIARNPRPPEPKPAQKESTSERWRPTPEQVWLKRREDGFEPIPFDSPEADRPYGYALAPTGRVLLGKEGIPFELIRHQSGEGHRIIEVHPAYANDQVARDIKPAEVKNVVALYVLLSAGDTRRTRGGQRFEGKEIGRLVIRFYGERESQVVPIRLGVEIREWVSGEARLDVVAKASAAKEVWSSKDDRYTIDMIRVDKDDRFTIDMIRVDIENGPSDVLELFVIGECKWLPGNYKDKLPSIRISGVTYKTVTDSEAEVIKNTKAEAAAKALAEPASARSASETSHELMQQQAAEDMRKKLTERQDALQKAQEPPNVITLEHPFHLDLIRIPAGEFLMGSDPAKDKNAQPNEQPQHRVYVSEFYIGKYPVTNAQYAASKRIQIPSGKENPPVVNISWNDAVAFCEWLSKDTGRQFRLPTEAEWEKAARGTDGRIYPWGDEGDAAKLNSREKGPKTITLVGAYSPQGDSPYGLADMSGNVWEWCADWYDEKEYQRRGGSTVKNPQGPSSGVTRALRGGSWGGPVDGARAAARYGLHPHYDWTNVGFRVGASPG